MTRRILAGFLAVLAVVIAAIIVPLGLVVSAQQRHDFTDSARAAAGSLATLAEEHVDDHGSLAALRRALVAAAAPGDRVALLDRGAVVAKTAQPPPAAVLDAARAGRPVPQLDGLVAVTAPVGDRARTHGTIVLARDSAPVRDRARTLWLALGGAALLALLLGAAVGWSLARWISRPLGSLVTAAHGIGTGRPNARADQNAGPVQVRNVAHAFNDMADRVMALVRNQRGMTAEVSHQLRTPLAALRLRLELMAVDGDGDAREEAAAMLTEIDRLARLVDGLLAIARAEATESAPVPTDLAQLITERLQAWTPVAAEREITLHRHVPATPTLAALTPGHLEQVLDNLLANAIDAVPPGGSISVFACRNDDHLLVRVDDTGPGVNEAQRAHAFDPFTTDRAHQGGTGLGLAIVGRLVATDHGSVSLHPAPGGGTRVEIELQPVTGSTSRHAVRHAR